MPDTLTDDQMDAMLSKGKQAAHMEQEKRNSVPDELRSTAKAKENRKRYVFELVWITFLPPVLIYLLGLGLMWVFSGFTVKQ